MNRDAAGKHQLDWPLYFWQLALSCHKKTNWRTHGHRRLDFVVEFLEGDTVSKSAVQPLESLVLLSIGGNPNGEEPDEIVDS
jgi:hypothetical protein